MKNIQVQEFFDAEEGRVEYVIGLDGNFIADQIKSFFSPDYLKNHEMLTGSAGAGRGHVHFFIADGRELVLRHYCRGGWVARFNKDQYRWQGLESTRAYCEFELLIKMKGMGLPVPTPYAARVCRSGTRYSADFITERILNAQSLAEYCSEGEIEPSLWPAVGKTIRRFHDRQVYHADLNAHNILISEGVVYLIDFDKCKINPHSNRWKKGNIDRLKRSLDKLKNKGMIYFEEKDWPLFLTAYYA